MQILVKSCQYIDLEKKKAGILGEKLSSPILRSANAQRNVGFLGCFGKGEYPKCTQIE